MDEKAFNELFVIIGYFSHRLPFLDWRLTEAVIPWSDMTYVVNGSAEYTINKVKYMVTKGDLLCAPQECLRSAFTFPNDLLECDSVSGPVYNYALQGTLLPFPVLSPIGLQADVISLLQELKSIWTLKESGYEMKARGLYMIILQRYYQLVYHNGKEHGRDRRVKKAIKYMLNHYAENLTINSVCREVGLSAAYFGGIFKKDMGVSFHAFLNDIRLNHADDMLYNGDYNVAEVAWASGFTDPFYFSKVYKESRGVSPSKKLL